MTETYNEFPNPGIDWTPPAPLHTQQARKAIEEYKRVANERETKPTLETKA